jgi:hypothetical protein
MKTLFEIWGCTLISDEGFLKIKIVAHKRKIISQLRGK